MQRMQRAMSSAVTTAVLRFVLAGLVAAVVISAGAYWVVSRNAVAEATRNAQEIAAIDGRSIVAPALTDAAVGGDPLALHSLDVLVHDRVLSARVVRVKIWAATGRIVYSDAAALIGRTYGLGEDELGAMRGNRVVAEVSQLSKPENQYERGYGQLVEVYLPIKSTGGATYLFETYQVYTSIVEDQQRIWSAFFPVLLGGIALLFIVQVPLAVRLATKLDSARREREMLLSRAIEASAAERRRIARDLHDGVVQDLAGAAFSLSAAAQRPEVAANHDLEGILAAGARATRAAVRDLRNLIVEIAPPNLEAGKLESALANLLAPLEADGLKTSLRVSGVASLDRERVELLYRAGQEALRNAAAHAGATTIDVQVGAEAGGVFLEVRDNGRGFTADEVIQRQQEGHVGLALLRGLVEDGGGEMAVTSEAGRGSTIRVKVAA